MNIITNRHVDFTNSRHLTGIGTGYRRSLVFNGSANLDAIRFLANFKYGLAHSARGAADGYPDSHN